MCGVLCILMVPFSPWLKGSKGQPPFGVPLASLSITELVEAFCGDVLISIGGWPQKACRSESPKSFMEMGEGDMLHLFRQVITSPLGGKTSATIVKVICLRGSNICPFV